MQRDGIEVVAVRRRVGVSAQDLEQPVEIQAPPRIDIVPIRHAREMDLRCGVGLPCGQMRHAHQLRVIFNRALEDETVGLALDIRLVPDDPAVHAERRVVRGGAAHEIGPQVTRIIDRQIQTARQAGIGQTVRRPLRRMLDDGDDLTAAVLGSAQPARIDIERVPVVRASWLVLCPVEDDAFPADAQLTRGLRQPERLDDAEAAGRRVVLRCAHAGQQEREQNEDDDQAVVLARDLVHARASDFRRCPPQ